MFVACETIIDTLSFMAVFMRLKVFKSLDDEFEFMQKTLVKYGGSLRDERRLYNVLSSAINTAVYEDAPKSQHILKHVEYLTNFSYKYFIQSPLSIDNIKKLHANILPPNLKGSFVYDDNGSKKIEKVNPGDFRKIDTYTKYKNIDNDFIPAEEIEEKLEEAILLFNNSKQSARDIFLFTLSFNDIHPFMDGNGKVTRVLTDVLLCKKGYYPSLYNSKKIDKDTLAYYLFLYEQNNDEVLENFFRFMLKTVYKINYGF